MKTRPEEDIRESYERQAGSYTALAENPEYVEHKRKVGARLAAAIDPFQPQSILDAGIGEASTTVPMLQAMVSKPKVFGFDISPARIDWAKKNMAAAGIEADLSVGSLRSINLSDRSVDVTVTFHAIEPNRGSEELILRELLRVSRKALVMVEPSYELANEAQRERMDKYNYIRGLPSALDNIGCEYTLSAWDLDIVTMNPAALFVVHIK